MINKPRAPTREIPVAAPDACPCAKTTIYVALTRMQPGNRTRWYYRHRCLSAQLGRFLSRDPIGYEGSERDLYHYSQSSPLRYVDPNGEFAVAVPALAPVAIGVTVVAVIGYAFRTRHCLRKAAECYRAGGIWWSNCVLRHPMNRHLLGLERFFCGRLHERRVQTVCNDALRRCLLNWRIWEPFSREYFGPCFRCPRTDDGGDDDDDDDGNGYDDEDPSFYEELLIKTGTRSILVPQ